MRQDHALRPELDPREIAELGQTIHQPTPEAINEIYNAFSRRTKWDSVPYVGTEVISLMTTVASYWLGKGSF